MLGVDTFLTALYVMLDGFRQSRLQKERYPGPDASLSCSEFVTLAIFARWSRFTSERVFYRYASSRLGDAFPTQQDNPPLRILHRPGASYLRTA